MWSASGFLDLYGGGHRSGYAGSQVQALEGIEPILRSVLAAGR